jgi:excisionase family DNA binding protein
VRVVKLTRQTPIEELPQFLSVEEFCAFTKIGRSAAYDLVRRGELEHVRFGKIIRIPRRVLERPTDEEPKP